MKRIFFMTLFVALTTITYSQTDDKGYEEGKWYEAVRLYC